MNTKKIGIIGLSTLVVLGMVLSGPSASAASLTQSQIDAIVGLLQSFGASASTISNVQAALAGQPTSGTPSTSSGSYTFSQNLTVGSKGADVKALQQFLNAHNYTIAKSGAGSPGNESDYFGPATKAALAKFQADQKISPAAGYFGPATRAKVNSMEGTTGSGSGTGSPVVNVPSGTGLMVTVAPSNPAAQNIAQGAVNTKMLSLNFSAGSQAVTVTGLNLTRGGLSQDADLQNVYLYQGSTRLSNSMGVSNGQINFSSASGLFTVPAGQTVTVDVTADIASTGASSHVITFSLASASSVTASGVTVGGTFPINGNAMTVVSVTLASLTFQNIPATTTVNAGQTGNLIGQFTLTAGSDPVKLTSLRLTETGSIPTNYLQNIKLMSGASQVGTTLSTLNGNVATFDLSAAPLMFAAGQSQTLSVYADVTGGVSYYFQFTVQQTSDIQAIDTMYNVGIGATVANSGTFPQNLYYVSVQQGGLVLNPASSSQLYVVAGNTNATLGNYSLLASGDSIRVQEVDLTVTASSSLQNVMIYLNGAQVGTTQSTMSALTYNVQNLNYVIPANTTVPVLVQATVSSSTPTTMGVTVQVKGQSQSNYASVSSASVSAPTLQVLPSTNNLTVSADPSFGSPVVAAGTSGAQIASFVLQAGQVNPVLLSGVTFQATSSLTSGWLSNMYVMINGTTYGSTQGNVTASGSYSFSGPQVTIAPNSSVKVGVYATVSTAANTSNVWVSMTGVNATAGNNAVTLASNVAGQTVAFSQGTTLTSVAMNTQLSPATTTMGMNVTGNTLAVYQLNGATSSPVSVSQITVLDASSTASTTANAALGTFNSLSLVVNGQSVASYPSFGTDGTITFVLSTPITVPQNNNVNVSLVGNTTNYNSYATGEATSHVFTFKSYVSNLATGATTTNVTGVTSNPITVYKTTLTSLTAGSVSAAGQTQVGAIGGNTGWVAAFNVGAGNGGDVYLQQLAVQQSSNVINTSTAITYAFYSASNPNGNSLGTITLTGNNATGTVTFSTSSATSGWDIPAGTTGTLLVKITSAGTTLTQTANVNFSFTVTGGVKWADGVSNGLTTLPTAVSLPVSYTITVSS